MDSAPPFRSHTAIVALILALLCASCAQGSRTTTAGGEIYDVVVYGCTSAGVAAAVQAARLERSPIMVCPEKQVGGMTAGGLGWTDSGNKEVIGGLSREFYQRVKQHYDQPEAWRQQEPEEYSRYRPEEDAMWVFEPHVAEATFEEMLREEDIPVRRGQYLDREDGVEKRDARLASITTLNGERYHGRIFVDATYEGDLMAAADVSYTTGREPNSKYGETLNGVQKANAVSHQFEHPVSAYVVPGDPSSGLLPKVHGGDPGEDGEGDHRIQAYNFRMCLTTAETNQVPFPKPEGYDPVQYELLGRYLDKGWRAVFQKFDPAPNWKTDTNNHGAFSTDNIGMNYDYPEAGYERRREIVAEHERYQKGLMWFLANDPRVPADVRSQMSEWGLCADEFTDNGNWPHQIYVREARRMVSDFVMTENHLRGNIPTPRSIGMGSYNMDSHNVQRYVDENGHARNEGDIQVNPGGPYPVSYGAIIPKAEEAENLLVPVAVSSSHIAYGSIRMEPVFMILGQSAAMAADIALARDIPVQQVDYEVLRDRLLEAGQVLEFAEDAASTEPIRPNSANPRYWEYEGAPTMLIGGSREDNLFQIPDLIPHLDLLSASGGNYIRNTMSSRDSGDVWPFHRLEDGRYDLNRLNDEYFERLENLLALAEQRDVIVQIELWDRFDFAREPWQENPYRPANNVNYSVEESGMENAYPEHPGRNRNPFFRTIPDHDDNTVVLPYQHAQVDRLMDVALRFPNVLYTMDNETSATPEWGAYWAKYIRERAEEAGAEIYTTEMWDDWDLKGEEHRRTLDHPSLYAFADVSQNNHNTGDEHWQNLQWVRDYTGSLPRPLNNVKIYGADSGRYGTDRDGVERFWRNIVGGAASVRFHRPGSGLGLSDKAQSSIRSARVLTEVFDLTRATPDSDHELLNRREENEAFLTRIPGEQYALYFPDGGAVSLDLSDTDGTFDVRWLDASEARFRDAPDVEGGGRADLEAPAKGHWIVVLSRSGSNAE